MAYTIAQAQKFFDAAEKNYLKALNAQEYTVKDREIIRARLSILSGEMDKWNRVLTQLNSGKGTGPKAKRAVI